MIVGSKGGAKNLSTDSSQPARVAIIGGGVAAMEAMLALNAASYSGTDVHLFSPESKFVLKPLAVSTGFGRSDLLTFDLPRMAATAGATFHKLSVSEVVTQSRLIRLSDDSEFSYDYLIASPGTESHWSVPGATPYWGPAGNEAVAEALTTLRDREDVKVVVTMPEDGSWPLPLYELALLVSDELGSGTSTTIVTPESSPLELFGKESAEKVAALLQERDIETLLETAPSEYRDGALVTTDGRRIEADLAVALPLLTGRRIPGLPYNERGFIPVDEFGRIEQHGREFAAGDVTSFPVKFGGLATEQADVVTTAIAAEALGGPAPEPFRPVYRGTLVTSDGLIGLGPGGESSAPYGWDPAEKVQGKFLTPFLKAADPATLGTRNQQ
jgi:sulfide:quinone oxidoreductase